MSRNRSLEEIQKDIRTLTRVPSEFIHAKLNEIAEEVGELTKTKWVPCSERIPKETVLCCDEYGNMLIGDISKGKKGYIAENDDDWFYCVAWMPLPEPYKGGVSR